MTRLTAEQKSALKPLIAREKAAYRALMRDPAVIARPSAPHSQHLMDEWMAACAAERAMRKLFDASTT